MKQATSTTSGAGVNERCAYLGLQDDPQTALAYPSPWNCCFRARPAAPVRLEYQRVFCQTAAHAACAMLRQEKPSALPPEIRGHRSVLRPTNRKGTLGLAGLILSLAALAVILWWAAGKPRVPVPDWSVVGTLYERVPFIHAAVTDVPAATPSPAAPAVIPMPTTAVLLPEQSPAPTLPKPPQQHALEVPIPVGDQPFVIHLVMGGETFEELTKQYDTTPEAIRALNQSLQGSLWANTTIVIAPGMKVVDRSLPVFTTYQVKSEQMIDDLAAALDISQAALRAYNGCEDNCQLAKGDWIMVPRSQ